MKKIVFLLIFSCTAAIAQQAKLGEPLKPEYRLGLGSTARLFATDETATGHSFICDMGQAIPSTERDDWYTNKPVSGLRLELRARAINKAETSVPDTDTNYGFIVIVKNEEVLKVFKPLGSDVFTVWDSDDTDIIVYSELLGADGYAEFDLLSGNGFYYKTRDSSPQYFLSNCRKIAKPNLPVYEYDFGRD